MMRIWQSPRELIAEGPPTKADLIWVILAVPLLLVQLSVIAHRLVATALGDDLLISWLFEISVSPTDPSWQLALGIAMYGTIVLFLLFLLWGCAMQLQSWCFWRKRH